jgi:hypothetical protein
MLAIPAAAPAQQPARWRLVEEWRVGGAVDGPHSLGDVRGMGLFADGHIVLFDAKDQQVHYLDAKGQPVRTVGRKGAGPGEFQRANGLAVSSRGEVVVNDPSNNRFTVLAPNGDLIKTFPNPNPWGFSYIWDAYFNTRNLLDEYVPVRKETGQTSIAARRVWSVDFSKADTIMPPECPDASARDPRDFNYEFRSARGGMVMNIPFVSPRASMARSIDGATWAGRYPDYATIEHVPAGKCEPDVTITLSGRVRIPAAMRDSAIDVVRTNAGRYGAPAPDLSKVPREFPAFDALFLDASRRLWVERRTDARSRRFEVYSAAGALIARVESPISFRGYRPVIITNDRALGFIADDDDVIYLASFRIVRG